VFSETREEFAGQPSDRRLDGFGSCSETLKKEMKVFYLLGFEARIEQPLA